MIARFAVRRPVTIAMAFLGACLLGAAAVRDLPVDLLPDLDAPRIAVLLRSGDRPPEELEDRFARPLESALATLPRVTSVRTVTSTGRVLAVIEYGWDVDVDLALVDVQTQVGVLATDRDVDALTVRRFDPSAEPIMVLALRAGPGDDLDALRRLADERVARALERVPGVALVEVAGGRRREVRVTIEPHRLAAAGLEVDEVVALLRAGNAEASGGTVEDLGRVHVIKGLGAFEDVGDVASLPIVARGPAAAASPAAASSAAPPASPATPAPSPGSRPLRLGEIAEVAWADAPVRGLVTLDGAEAVSLSVYEESGENTVAVSGAVREALARLQPDLGGAPLVVVRDQAAFIRDAMDEVRWAAVAGGLLSILVLLPFLRSGRAILLVAIAIPVSVVVTLAALAALGMSLNVMTLGGIALGTGIVIDNAIVVLEAIVRRLEEGATPSEAAELGTSEVAAAVTAATLTACVVFVPVVFLRGIAAELFADLAITVVLQLLASLAVALLLVPAAASKLFRAGARLGRGGDRLAAPYARALRSALRRPGAVLGAAAVLVAATCALLPAVGLDLLPSTGGREVIARLLMPEGSRVGVTAQAAARLEDALRSTHPEGVELVHAELGEAVREDVVLSEDVPAENRGILRVVLSEDAAAAGLGAARVARVLEAAAGTVTGLSVAFESSDAVLSRLAQRGPPVRVELRGQDLVRLEEATAQVASALSRLPEVFNVRSSFDDRRAEVRVTLDRTHAAAHGLSPEDIGRQLRQRLGAESATTFRREGEERDVVVRGAPAALESLPRLTLETPAGEPVRLGDLADVAVVSSPTRIERALGTRLGVVGAQLSEGASLGEASAAVERTLAGLALPQGVRASVAGAEIARRASFDELALAAVLAALLVYMVMAALFESLVHPFTILLTLPTALVGVVLALAVTATPLSLPALIGVVMLAGIAVNNGILLVDVANALREEGMGRMDALVEAGRLRLRPILMTSITTVLGVLPMAFGDDGSDLRAPLAVAVVGGVVSSTVLTLAVIPAAYVVLDRLRPRGRALEAAADARA